MHKRQPNNVHAGALPAFFFGPCVITVIAQVEVSTMPVSTGEAAKRLNVSPGVIATLLYRSPKHSAHCPIVCGRRQIPTAYLPVIAAEIRERQASKP